ncbi:MAG TPA: T9SS type A sorting domain-containing protein [Bacteroidales bacterium]|nr:T9SS type A sorting domain-containing protein [Bacteroidales bacterium]
MKKIIISLIALLGLSGAEAQNWQWLNPWPQVNYLRCVRFVNENTRYAVGAAGTIMRTTMEADWVLQFSYASNPFYSVFFPNDTTGFVVGYGGSIFKTINGGSDWFALSSGTASNLSSLCFTDADTGYAVGDNGTILKTTNGGDFPACLPEGITFTTQEQIDNFQANYPGCTEIEGDVTISGYNITNLNGLNVLTSIGGTLTIGVNGWMNYNLTSLTGLENLTFIGEDLLIGGTGLGLPGNPNLTSLTGLENLTSIGGKLSIKQNPALTNLNGLEGLTSIEGNIHISNNENLTNCSAQSICDYLTSPNGVVDIFENGPGCNSQSEVASDCGGSIPCLPFGNYYFLLQTDIDNFQTNFPACNELDGNLTITGNSISNLTGLNQVFSIGGSLDIQNCGSLTNLTGLNNLLNVGGNIYLFHNESLISCSGLENLNSIGGSLRMYENNQLLSLSGLENLDAIGGWLGIGTIWNVGDPLLPGGNDLLVNLSPLQSLTYVGAGIDIGQNNSLLSLSGLENIYANTVTDLLIGYNSSLSSCEVQSVCDYLSSPNGTIMIEYNAPGCNSPEEVEAACTVGVGELVVGGKRSTVSVAPNPASPRSNIKYQISKSKSVVVKVLDIRGSEISTLVNEDQAPGEHIIPFDASGLPAGIYFIWLQAGEDITTTKLVVMR